MRSCFLAVMAFVAVLLAASPCFGQDAKVLPLTTSCHKGTCMGIVPVPAHATYFHGKVTRQNGYLVVATMVGFPGHETLLTRDPYLYRATGKLKRVCFFRENIKKPVQCARVH
jgi:hypothetical protein